MNLFPKTRPGVGNEQGFILILTLIILVLLTLFGIWAMQTSDTEIRVASNTQHMETANYLSEAGSATEAALVGGNSKVPEYKLTSLDPAQVLLPENFDGTGAGLYPKEPGETDVSKFEGYKKDMYKTAYGKDKTMGNSRLMDREYGNPEAYLQAHAEYWPMTNIRAATERAQGKEPDYGQLDRSIDYQYLVTFMNAGSSPILNANDSTTEASGGVPGFSADIMDYYWFRTQGKQPAREGLPAGVTVMERGGFRLGPKTL